MINKKTVKIVFLIVIIFSMTFLNLRSLTLRTIMTLATYYPEYPYYYYEDMLFGFNLNMDFLNVYQNYGIGAKVFYKLKSNHPYIQNLETYEVYLHNFFGSIDDETYFIYGVFGGVRQTKICYGEYKTDIDVDLTIIRPVFGFHFSDNNWGITLCWTQNNDNKPKLEYDFKLRSSKNIIFQIGGSLKGPVDSIKSDFHIHTGYEFVL
ncbi:MAG: hypothetical protein KAT74_11310 [Candidatus Cloacimonetes bacterium]|nr:hypothetical protein [Candidatus Cloacimonadota bacterium]